MGKIRYKTAPIDFERTTWAVLWASSVSWYQLTIFESGGVALNSKFLLGCFPNPLWTAFARCWLRVRCERFDTPKTKKNARDQCKIGLWRSWFIDSVAEFLWAFLLPESVSNSAVPAKAAASRREPCGIPGRPFSSAWVARHTQRSAPSPWAVF